MTISVIPLMVCLRAGALLEFLSFLLHGTCGCCLAARHLWVCRPCHAARHLRVLSVSVQALQCCSAPEGTVSGCAGPEVLQDTEGAAWCEWADPAVCTAPEGLEGYL